MSTVVKTKKAPAAHPATSVMVMAAVKGLKERNGSSLAAIKKFIAANYKVDIVKLAPFVKKAVKSLTEKKMLIQTKGSGASGSFKVNPATKPAAAVKKPKAKKVVKKKATSSPKKAGAKKTSPKKKTAAKKSTSTATKKVVKKASSPKKTAAKKPAAKKSSPKKKTATKKVAAKK